MHPLSPFVWFTLSLRTSWSVLSATLVWCVLTLIPLVTAIVPTVIAAMVSAVVTSVVASSMVVAALMLLVLWGEVVIVWTTSVVLVPSWASTCRSSISAHGMTSTVTTLSLVVIFPTSSSWLRHTIAHLLVTCAPISATAVTSLVVFPLTAAAMIPISIFAPFYSRRWYIVAVVVATTTVVRVSMSFILALIVFTAVVILRLVMLVFGFSYSIVWCSLLLARVIGITASSCCWLLVSRVDVGVTWCLLSVLSHSYWSSTCFSYSSRVIVRLALGARIFLRGSGWWRSTLVLTFLYSSLLSVIRRLACCRCRVLLLLRWISSGLVWATLIVSHVHLGLLRWCTGWWPRFARRLMMFRIVIGASSLDWILEICSRRWILLRVTIATLLLLASIFWWFVFIHCRWGSLIGRLACWPLTSS